MKWPNALRHPVVLIGLVLVALTLHALAVGSHLSIVTEIVIYVLYGAGLNVMLGYTGLVPFGASVFFGIATYVAAVGVQRFVGNEVEALILSVVVSVLMGLALVPLVLLRRGLWALAADPWPVHRSHLRSRLNGRMSRVAKTGQNVPREPSPTREPSIWCVCFSIVRFCGACGG
jgi:hypothetical protein